MKRRSLKLFAPSLLLLCSHGGTLGQVQHGGHAGAQAAAPCRAAGNPHQRLCDRCAQRLGFRHIAAPSYNVVVLILLLRPCPQVLRVTLGHELWRACWHAGTACTPRAAQLATTLRLRRRWMRCRGLLSACAGLRPTCCKRPASTLRWRGASEWAS